MSSTVADRTEKALIEATFDRRAAQLERVRAEMAADIARLRAGWNDGYGDRDARLADLQTQHAEWLAGHIRSLLGVADEPAPTDVQGRVGASAAGNDAPASGGLGPGHNPHEDEAELVRMIAEMPMDEYMRRRAELGVHPSTSMDHLFIQEPR